MGCFFGKFCKYMHNCLKPLPENVEYDPWGEELWLKYLDNGTTLLHK